MANTVSVERDGETATVVLNRPDRLNALHLETAQLLLTSLQELAQDSGVSCVVITGNGRAFCAGGDLAWARSYAGGVGAAFHTLAGCFHQSVIEIARMEKPVIAAINGVAAGAGFSLALACDFRILDRTAILRQAYTSAGLCIDGGGTFMLPRLVGLARALEIAAFDRPIDAERAQQFGLALRVVDPGRSVEEARTLATELSGASLFSFVWSKRLLRGSYEAPLEIQLEREREGIAACARAPEGKEGLQAFMDKRKPDFRHARLSMRVPAGGTSL
jgi:2-(1,2-epoxy-1,2-dihydrophenyl)acetyl-CoA isomerase